MDIIVLGIVGWSLFLLMVGSFIAFFVRYRRWRKKEIQKINGE